MIKNPFLKKKKEKNPLNLRILHSWRKILWIKRSVNPRFVCDEGTFRTVSQAKRDDCCNKDNVQCKINQKNYLQIGDKNKCHPFCMQIWSLYLSEQKALSWVKNTSRIEVSSRTLQLSVGLQWMYTISYFSL